MTYNYPILREEFVKLFKETFINCDELLELIATGYESEKFILKVMCDEVYIIYLPDLNIINWYKLYHIGRVLTSNVKSFYEIANILNKLNLELTENNIL